MNPVSKRFALALAVTILFAGVAHASSNGPSWRYVEGGYLNVDVDSLSDSGDNYFLGAAFGFGSFHVIGQWSTGDAGPDADLDVFRLGLGWHGLLGDQADVLGEAYYVDQSVDTPGGDSDDSGYRITGGIRWTPIDLFELDGFVNYNDYAAESETSWEGRAILNIWRLGFGVGYEKFDDADQYNAFIRFNFGR
jgi:hypothetical protein